MLNRLAILGIVCLAAITSGSPQDASGKRQSKAQSNPPSTVTIVDNSSRQAEANPPEQKAPESHTRIEWANWALVLVGAITFLAVWRQAKESARATEIMRESVQTQAAGLKQWIDVQIMGSDWNPPTSIMLKFNAANQTPYPLTIKGILVKVSGNRSGDPKWEEFPRKEETILSPGVRREVVIGQADTSQYQFLAVVGLDAPMVEAYRRNNLTLSISGHISFKPVIGPIEKQVFGEMVVCGHNRVQVLPLWTVIGENTDGN